MHTSDVGWVHAFFCQVWLSLVHSVPLFVSLSPSIKKIQGVPDYSAPDWVWKLACKFRSKLVITCLFKLWLKALESPHFYLWPPPLQSSPTAAARRRRSRRRRQHRNLRQSQMFPLLLSSPPHLLLLFHSWTLLLPPPFLSLSLWLFHHHQFPNLCCRLEEEGGRERETPPDSVI